MSQPSENEPSEPAERKPSPRAPAFSWRREAARLADEYPVFQAALEGLGQGQQRVLVELKTRLDALEREREAAAAPSPAERLAELSAAAGELDAGAARARLYDRALAQLVPDEALMFAYLAEHEVAPLAHVAVARWPLGRARFVLLANASTLARAAGVLLPERGCDYVGRLRAVGLCRIEPPGRGLGQGFELLRAETDVREAMEAARAYYRGYPRLQRYALRLSTFGRALWRDCAPERAGDGRAPAP